MTNGMALARFSTSLMGWLATVVMLANSCIVGLWALLTKAPRLFYWAFGMLAGAFVVAGVMSVFLRRFHRQPDARTSRVWILAGVMLLLLGVALTVAYLVTLPIVRGTFAG